MVPRGVSRRRFGYAGQMRMTRMTACVLAVLLAAAHSDVAAAASVPASPAPAAHFRDADADVLRVLQLADQRLALMPAVAAWKWQHHTPVTAPAREQAVIAHAGQLAHRLGLSEGAVERVFALQVRLARDEESRLDDHWHATGYDYRAATRICSRCCAHSSIGSPGICCRRCTSPPRT